MGCATSRPSGCGAAADSECFTKPQQLALQQHSKPAASKVEDVGAPLVQPPRSHPERRVDVAATLSVSPHTDHVSSGKISAAGDATAAAATKLHNDCSTLAAAVAANSRLAAFDPRLAAERAESYRRRFRDDTADAETLGSARGRYSMDVQNVSKRQPKAASAAGRYSLDVRRTQPAAPADIYSSLLFSVSEPVNSIIESPTAAAQPAGPAQQSAFAAPAAQLQVASLDDGYAVTGGNAGMFVDRSPTPYALDDILEDPTMLHSSAPFDARAKSLGLPAFSQRGDMTPQQQRRMSLSLPSSAAPAPRLARRSLDDSQLQEPLPPPVIYTYADCGGVSSRIVVGSTPPGGGEDAATPALASAPSRPAPAPITRKSSADLVAELAAEFGLCPDDDRAPLSSRCSGSLDGGGNYSADSSCHSSSNADWRPTAIGSGPTCRRFSGGHHGSGGGRGRASSLPLGNGTGGGGGMAGHGSGGPLGTRRLSATGSDCGGLGGSGGSDSLRGGSAPRGTRRLSFRSDNSLNNTPFPDLKLGGLLGKGSFGSVYTGYRGEESFAVKLIHHTGMNGGTNQKELEATLGLQLAHPNVVRTFEFATRASGSVATAAKKTAKRYSSSSVASVKRGSINPGSGGDESESAQQLETWILLELCDAGSLQAAIDGGKLRLPAAEGAEAGPPDMTRVLACAMEMASALNYLHGESINHGDLTCSNVLLLADPADARGFCTKVSDFGLSRTSHGTMHTNSFGTVTHMPPELLSEGRLSQKADLYAFGIIMWEMYTSKRPWAGMHPVQVMMKKAQGGAVLSWPPGTPEPYSRLAQACMADDPAARPEFAEVEAECRVLAKMAAAGTLAAGNHP